MSAASFTAAIPEPFRILGLRLLPLSLGRYRLMKRFEVAFVADGEATAGIGDLLTGVLICSMRCDEFLAFYDSPDCERAVRQWSKSICPHAWIGLLPWVGKWWRSRNSFNVVEKMELFKRYIEEGSAMPKYFEKDTRLSASGAHWSHTVEVALRSEVNWSAEEINEAPLTKALSDYFKYAESQGSVQLMTDEEVEQAESNERLYRDLVARGVLN